MIQNAFLESVCRANSRNLIIIIVLLVATLYSPMVEAQSSENGPERTRRSATPKREFRGVWVTTYANLDWPSKKGLPSDFQRAEFLQILDSLQAANINAVIVQVRPAADALYPSKMNPWSEFLAGKQGKAPEPYYDPLSFMVEACHERFMEFHAWFNPFRAICNLDYSDIHASHISKTMPSWIFEYGQSAFLNPGIPEAREHFIHSVLEVVQNYDIDGVHFDDYYYPYTIYGENIPDEKLRHHSNFDADTWRRENINDLIKKTYNEIKACKPYVKFGVGPFAVWRNASRDPEGSNTKVGQTAYDNLYSDVKLWVEKGWLDYVAPQLYWDFEHRSANYVELMDWWTKLENQKHLYIGHAIYKVGNIWKSEMELLDQIKYSRIQRASSGELFYRASSFLTNPMNVNGSLRSEVFKYPALPPTMPWLKIEAPAIPQLNCVMENGQLRVSWKKRTEDDYFIVYKVGTRLQGIEEPANIYARTRSENISLPLLKDEERYVITACNRLHVESRVNPSLNVVFPKPEFIITE